MSTGSLLSKFLRCTKGRPCPVCGKKDWCLVARDGNMAICSRIRDGAVKIQGEAGWLHQITGGTAPRSDSSDDARVIHIDVGAVHAKYERAMTRQRREEQAAMLGVSARTLEMFRVGWNSPDSALAIPMFEADGTVVGVRFRSQDARKWSLRGGKNGVFAPGPPYPNEECIICEGATDAFALFEIGFDGVLGRASCSTSASTLCAALQYVKQEVSILADHDQPGIDGANALAGRLYAVGVRSRIATPPEGVKDARIWVKRGATYRVIVEHMHAQPLWRPDAKL
jgi:5S rRNA maturation endonuclease (ribonuclease M5)